LRAAPILLTVLLVLPMTGSLMLPPAADRGAVDDHALVDARRLAAQATPPLPADLPDAQLLILLAALDGIHLELPEKDAIRIAADDTIPTAALRLAHRGGATEATLANFGMFAALDPRVAGPVLTLLVAVEMAWDLRDEAFAAVPAEDMQEMQRLAFKEDLTPEERARLLALGDPMDREALLRAALLLLDTIESIVVPALEDAVAQQAWPEEATYDEVGVLRLGGTGNDVETRTRIVQIDPSGDDAYYNNAGATTVVSDLDPTTLDVPVGISVDFQGNDWYQRNDTAPAQGSGVIGVGVLHDFGGADSYRGKRYAQAGNLHGTSILHDWDGDDRYRSGQDSIASGNVMAILRDDSGNDIYTLWSLFSGSYTHEHGSTSLLWDRNGVDEYLTESTGAAQYGWGDTGRAWLVDEGEDVDFYETSIMPFYTHGCNNCLWEAGGLLTPESTGRGNDNYGGLAYMLADSSSTLDVS
jgi:hypothetical protein